MAPKRVVKKAAVAKAMGNPFPTLTGDQVQPGKFLLFYGEPGVGKTTVAAHAPHPLFVTTSSEKGIQEAVSVGVVPAEVADNIVVLPALSDPSAIPAGGHPAWTTLMDIMDTFLEEEHTRRTLIIDTASGLQPICHQHCASMLFDCNMDDPAGFMNYQQGYLKAAEHYWNGEFLARCNKLTTAGYNVVLICHSTTMAVPNHGGTDFECYAPALIKGAKKENTYDYTMKTCSAVLYFGQHTAVSTRDRTTKVSAQYGFIGVRGSGWFTAKNWYNLTDEIECGSSAAETWTNLNTKLPVV